MTVQAVRDTLHAHQRSNDIASRPVRRRPILSRRSGARLPRLPRLPAGSRGPWLSRLLPDRASLHRLGPGLRPAAHAVLSCRPHHAAPAWHRRDGAGLAQPDAACRTGGDHRCALRRPARPWHWPRLPPQRISRLCDGPERSRSPLRRIARRHDPRLDEQGTFLPPRPLLALRRRDPGAAAAAIPSPSALGQRRPRRLDQSRRRKPPPIVT